jgi:hypothetical protein
VRTWGLDGWLSCACEWCGKTGWVGVGGGRGGVLTKGGTCLAV